MVSYLGQATWNSLPSELRDISDINTLKKRLTVYCLIVLISDSCTALLQTLCGVLQTRPTQPPTLAPGREISTSQSAVMLCGWGVRAGMVHFIVDKRVGGR